VPLTASAAAAAAAHAVPLQFPELRVERPDKVLPVPPLTVVRVVVVVVVHIVVVHITAVADHQKGRRRVVGIVGAGTAVFSHRRAGSGSRSDAGAGNGGDGAAVYGLWTCGRDDNDRDENARRTRRPIGSDGTDDGRDELRYGYCIAGKKVFRAALARAHARVADHTRGSAQRPPRALKRA